MSIETHSRSAQPANDSDPSHRNRTRRAMIGSTAAAAVAAIGLVIFNSGESKATSDGPYVEPINPDKVSAGPANPGKDENKQPEVQAPASNFEPPELEYYFTENLSAEEARQPAVLSAEQITSWNSGDSAAHNKIVDVAGAQRLETALNDLYWAAKAGEEADISYISSDPMVANYLKANVIPDFIADNIPDSEYPFIYVLRAVETEVNPSGNFATSDLPSFSPNNPMQLTLLRPTMSDKNGELQDNRKVFDFTKVEWAVNGGILELTTQQ